MEENPARSEKDLLKIALGYASNTMKKTGTGSITICENYVYIMWSTKTHVSGFRLSHSDFVRFQAYLAQWSLKFNSNNY